MDTAKIEQIIDKHHCEASSLIEILLDIQNELHWLPEGSAGAGRREIAGAREPDPAYGHFLQGVQPGAQGAP